MLNNQAAAISPLAPRSASRDQRARMLTIIIWIAFGAAVILGLFDIQFHTWPSVYTLLGMAAFCIPTLWLNRAGHYRAAAWLLSLIVLIVITINMYDGDGVRDPGLMAYPIFVTAGALFFGRRAAPVFAGAAALSLVVIVMGEITGQIRPTLGRTGIDILLPLGVLLAAAAAIIWTIVGNMEKNLQRAESSEAELSKNYDLTIEAFSKVMEYRDLETEGHSRRVVDVATRLARRLGVGDSEILHLQRGALLHDIGKLAIPDEILLKPTALDDTERQLIEKHPVYAKQMLEDIPFLAPAIPVAYSHHERWDGLGYPDGLKGENIPLAARLFAVVDTWDALSAKRIYRPAWPKDEIVAYLRLNAGARFDPRIVQVFLEMMGEA